VEKVDVVKEWAITASVGGVLIVIGLLMIRAHVIAWRRQKQDDSLDELDRKHYAARYRRRLQTSALITALGFLIPLGDLPWLWKQRPAIATAYWAVILLAPLWIILLAAADLWATQTYGRVALSRIRQKQRVLEKQVETLKKRGSNGRTDR